MKYNIDVKRFRFNSTLVERWRKSDLSEIYDMFDYKFAIEVNPYYVYPRIYFKLKHSLLDESIIRFDLDTNSFMCYHCNSYFCMHAYHASIFLENKLDTDDNFLKDLNLSFEKLYENYNREKKLKEMEEARKRSLYYAKRLVTDIKQKEVIPLDEKVKFECHITTDTQYKLTIKVGFNKMYVMQSFFHFFDCYINNSFYKLGKTAGFTCAKENFDERTLGLIRYCALLPNNNYRTISLNTLQFEDIVLLLKDSFITINEELLYVSLEEKEVSLSLKEDYSLKVANDYNVLKGFINDYVVYKNTLYKASYPTEGFRTLVHRNSEINFEYAKSIFEEQIYPRFSNKIEVNDQIKKEIKLEEFDIKAYFDIDDRVLSVKSEYYLNKALVSEKVVSEKYFNYTLYKDFLVKLGFVDNVISDTPLISNFIKTDFTEIRKICEVFLSDAILNMKFKSFNSAQTKLSYDVGMISIFFEESQFSDDELDCIIKSLRKKVRFIKLDRNTIVEVSEEEGIKLLNTIDEFNLDPSKLTKPQQIPLYQSLKIYDKNINIVDFSLDEKLEKMLSEVKNYKNTNFVVPLHLESVMRDYQKDAFKWMSTLAKYDFSGILADDMGLGKTLEVISVLASNTEDGNNLIVCPKSLCYNWKNEFGLWANDHEVCIIIGTPNERKSLIENMSNTKNVNYIISYDTLRNDIEKIHKEKFKFVILDEAQTIKNHVTLKSQSVKLLNAKYRFVLTGTPIENTIMDLWSIFDFLMPNYLGTQIDFKKHFERAVVTNTNKEIIDRLVLKITPFVLRRTKEEVLSDLPSKIEVIQMASMEKEQRKIYDAQLKKTKDLLISDPKNKILILSQLTRLRQICVDPNLFIDDYQGKVAKYELLIELVDEYISEGHKIIIFSQFTQSFVHIAKLLEMKNYEYFVLTGKTEALNRVEMATAFNDPTSPQKIFLVSLKAGGTGLNLTGADIVIHLDPWWNYAVENQATDRAHRIGQTNSVNVIKIIAENSIEQKVIELQQIKKEIADRIISSDDSTLDTVKVDDIKYLLEN